MALIGFDDEYDDPNQQRKRIQVPGLRTDPSAVSQPLPGPLPTSDLPLPKPGGITSTEFPKFPTPQPVQRWSQAYERPPASLGTNPDTLNWAKTFFDREGGAEEFWGRLSGFRNEAQQKGMRVNETDADVIQSDLFRNWNPGSLQAQSPAPQPMPQQAQPPQAPQQRQPQALSMVPPAQQPPANVPAQFTDPITSYVEAFAQQRAQEREAPPTGSGQALLEQTLRNMAGQFQGGGYTPAETEIFQTQAIEPIEKLRASRKQQVLHNLASRGLNPDSGIAKQMLADVDRQMDAARIETQRTLAGSEAQERTKRMLQAIELLSGLSDQENRRKNEGFQYRNVPVQLADRSFNQSIQAYNAGGNPLTLAQPLIQLQQLQQGRGNDWQQALGYLAAILANGG